MCDLLDVIWDNIFSIKITNRKIACVPLDGWKGASICGITDIIVYNTHFTILVTALPIV